MKRRILLLLAILALLLVTSVTLAACTGGEEPTPTEAPTDAPTDPVTDPVTDAPTEPETTPVSEPETDPGTLPETEPETEPATETEEETVLPPEVKDVVLGQANVARQGYALASSSKTGSYRNVYANDGDYTTAFSSKGGDAEPYLFIDLAGTFRVGSVVLYPLGSARSSFPTDFEIQTATVFGEYVTAAVVTGAQVPEDGEGLTVTFDGGAVDAAYVRLVPAENKAFVLAEMEVMADIDPVNNLVLNMNDVWLYDDTSVTLTVTDNRTGTNGNQPLTYISTRPSVLIAGEDGMLTPVGYGDADVYVYDGLNLARCHVRVIDERVHNVRISTFYHSSFGHPDVIPQALDYMVDMGIEYLEDTRTYDAVGNQICEWMLHLCAERGLFYSVCDPINSGSWLKLTDAEILDVVRKYEHRAAFGGLYLIDEPTSEADGYAHVAKVIQTYNPHLSAHLNLLPPIGNIWWDPYVYDVASILGDTFPTHGLSYDCYGMQEGALFGEYVYLSMDGIRRFSLMSDVAAGYYIQAMGITNVYRVSNEYELMFNAMLGLGYGFKNFKYFVYLAPFDCGEAFTTGILTLDFEPSSMVPGITAANARLKEFGALLYDADAVEVWHDMRGQYYSRLPDSFPLHGTEAASKRDYCMYTLYVPQDGKGRQMVFVMNKIMRKGGCKDYTFFLSEGIDGLERWVDGAWVPVGLADDRSFTVYMNGGDAELFRLPEGYDARQPAAARGENLAEGCMVYVSSSFCEVWNPVTSSAMFLTDGKKNEWRWYATSADKLPTVTLDLGSVLEIGRVDLTPAQTALSSFPASYEILVSENGEAFTPVVSREDVTVTDNTTVSHEFTPVSARYVRIVMHTKGASLGEIEVFR